jgi:hypothetical protein
MSTVVSRSPKQTTEPGIKKHVTKDANIISKI